MPDQRNGTAHSSGDDLNRSDLPLDNLASESGVTARTPDPTKGIDMAPTAGGASSPRRSLAEIRATGAAWIAESEIAAICDVVNEAETLTSRAHDALYAEPFDRQVVSGAIWKIHDAIRGLRDGR